MKKFFIHIIAFLGLLSSLSAQKLPLNNQYLINRYSLSPAYAGHHNNVEGYLGYRKQWVDVKGAPITKMFNVNAAVGDKVGVGGTIMSDIEGIFNRFHASLTYAYHLSVAENHIISFGLTGRVYENTIDPSKMVILDPNDPVIENRKTLSEAKFNAGASLLYRFKGFNLGVSAPMLLNNQSGYSEEYEKEFPDSPIHYMLKRHYVGHLCYDFKIGDNLQITPYGIVRKADVSPINYDAALMIKFFDKAWLNGSYRGTGDIGVGGGLQIKNTIHFNYTYEFSSKGIGGQSAGTHEINIGFNINKQKPEEKKSDDDDKEVPIQKDTVTVTQADSNLLKEIEKLQDRLKDIELELSNLKESYSGNELKQREGQLQGEIDDIEGRMSIIDAEKDYYVIVESFKYPENAQRAVGLWKARGYETAIIHNEKRGWYYIVIGTYSTYAQASEMKNRLVEKGIENWIFIKADY